ncbi:hypothetical protein HK104_006872, partial [Borealophlyctis nickersoniae]
MSYRPQQQGSPQSAAPANKWAAAAQAAEHQARTGSSAYNYNWQNIDEAPEDYNDSEWLSAKTKNIQNESLQSSRRALAKLNEAEGVGQSNLDKLNKQSGELQVMGRGLLVKMGQLS